MIRLGTCDQDCIPRDRRQYFRHIHEPSMLGKNLFRGEREGRWLNFTKSGESVIDLQRFLKQVGFMPFGKMDGLCGYRTASSMRLFQEYVRTVEGETSIGSADGVFGPAGSSHVERWQRDGIRADWDDCSSDRPSPEYTKWMGLLQKVKKHYLIEATTLLRKVNDFSQVSDTPKVADWDLNPNRTHLIGVRRDETKPGKRQN